MAEETPFEQDEIQSQEAPQEIEIEELNDENLEDVAGGANNGCTINNSVAC